MKKILTTAISVLMIFMLGACESEKTTTNDSSSKIAVNDPSLETSDLANMLGTEFYNMVNKNPDMSTQEIADAIIANEAITFNAMTMPVENGLLIGFGNNEVNGFKEGIMFGPSISSIPFIGYIFKVDDNTSIVSFISNLNNNADKRWNICTEADSISINNVGNTVFFVMAPNSLEDEGDSLEENEDSLIEEAEKEREELDSMEEDAEKKREEVEKEVSRLKEEAEGVNRSKEE